MEKIFAPMENAPSMEKPIDRGKDPRVYPMEKFRERRKTPSAVFSFKDSFHHFAAAPLVLFFIEKDDSVIRRGF